MKKLLLKNDNPSPDESKRFMINGRKYLGNKTNFLPLIDKVIKDENLEFSSVLEGCMGTGVISWHFLKKGKKIVGNDLLPLNFVIAKSFMPEKEIDLQLVEWHISKINVLSGTFGIITKTYRDRFFPISIAQHIDSAICYLKNLTKISEIEKFHLASSFILAVEKASNIDSDYLGIDTPKKNKELCLILRPLKHICSSSAMITNEDITLLSKKIYADLIILDPPFGFGDYKDYMSLPEKIVELIFPDIIPPKRSDFTNKEKAKERFKVLVKNLKCKYLMLFYSLDGLVSKEDMVEILSNHFQNLKVFDIARTEGLHLVRDEPKTDYLIVGKRMEGI